MPKPIPRSVRSSDAGIDRYDVPIDSCSYEVIERLIVQAKLFEPGFSLVTGDRPGRDPKDRIYYINAGVEITPCDDSTIEIDAGLIQADLYRMPSHTYLALTACKDFRAYSGLDEVLTLMQDGARPEQITVAIEDCVAAGRQPGQPPQLIRKSPYWRATWLPDLTAVVRRPDGSMFMSFAYSTDYYPLDHDGRRSAVGIDVGWSPMCMLYHSDGRKKSFSIPRLSPPRCDTLSWEAKQLLEQLVYAHGRATAEAAIDYIVQNAERVYAEQLCLRGMSDVYRRQARAYGINDFHFAWLRQACWRADIRFKRVPSPKTSQRCPACGHTVTENRQGGRFCCVDCGFTANAHFVAAANIFKDGWQEDPGAQRLYPWPTPPKSDSES